ncbi:MAG: IS1380 family transposase [Deltaproteobacteria bacterium]|nr:IS1380 family transposase [Deltaproteobacteria bacterium]
MNDDSVIGKGGKCQVCLRAEQLTSPAGVVLVHELAPRRGVEQLVDEELQVKQRERGYTEGQAIGALVHNLLLGGECLSDLEVLRGDPGTQELLAQDAILAPRTAREFLQKFDLGDIRDLQRVNVRLQQRVRPQQTSATCTIDLDSSIYEQASSRKQGSDKAYNGEIGYHPLLAFWAEEGELLFSHLRRGSAHTCRNVLWFLRETFKRVPAQAALALRAGSGFYSKEVVQWCEAHHVRFSITADQTAPLLALIEAVPDRCWTNLPDYPLCEVTELRYQPVRWRKAYRYVVKRQLTESKEGELSWHYHGFVTNDAATPAPALEGWHLQHADMENRIKEHKSGLGLEKLPSGGFHVNWAYLLIGQIAFNLLAWFKKLVLPSSYHHATLKTIRHHLLNLAGKIVHSARQCFLVLSNRYRYQAVWQFALGRLAHLQFN